MVTANLEQLRDAVGAALTAKTSSDAVFCEFKPSGLNDLRGRNLEDVELRYVRLQDAIVSIQFTSQFVTSGRLAHFTLSGLLGQLIEIGDAVSERFDRAQFVQSLLSWAEHGDT